MEPEYQTRQSALYEFSFFWCVILLLLGVVPGVIYITVKILGAHHRVILFYKDKIVLKSGVINSRVDEAGFKGIVSASFSQSLKGKMFHFGDVTIDVGGARNLSLTGVKSPGALMAYLKTRQLDTEAIGHVMTN